MKDHNITLTEDQKKRIDATLKRIRAGLSLSGEIQETSLCEEPPHIFVLEAFNVS